MSEKLEVSEIIPPAAPKMPAAITKNEVATFKEALKKTDIEEIEGETSKYVKDVFDMVRRREGFLEALEAELLNRISELSPAQLIALLGNTGVNTNDAINKALAPTAQLLTERQRTEAAKAAAAATVAQSAAQIAGGGEMRKIAETAGQDTLIGLQTLANLMAQAKQISQTDREQNAEEKEGTT
jgi:hypothetical protein